MILCIYLLLPCIKHIIFLLSCWWPPSAFCSREYASNPCTVS